MGCCFLLQGNLPSPEMEPSLLHCRQILYHVSRQGDRFWILRSRQSSGQLWPSPVLTGYSEFPWRVLQPT